MKGLATSHLKRKQRRLQTENDESTATDAETPTDEFVRSESYGLAYRDLYEGGFYYGDVKADGEFPPCFEDDLECQRVSESQEKMMLGILLSVVGVVFVIVVIICLCFAFKKKNINKKG